MIFGIGTDICERSRISAILAKSIAKRFVERILTSSEQEKFYALTAQRQVEYLAGRFALKEAVSKALGTGIGERLSFLDIETNNDDLGKPICTLSPVCYSRFNLDYTNTHINVSISHEKLFAIAFVVIEIN